MKYTLQKSCKHCNSKFNSKHRSPFCSATCRVQYDKEHNDRITTPAINQPTL